MSCKSAIYAVNTTAGTAIANGGVYAPTTVVRRYGPSIQMIANGIQLSGVGYYEVSPTATVTATAIGNVVATLLQDGIPVPGATATVTAAAIGDEVTLSIPTSLVRVKCNCVDSILTVEISGQATTAYNFAISVEKE